MRITNTLQVWVPKADDQKLTDPAFVAQLAADTRRVKKTRYEVKEMQ